MKRKIWIIFFDNYFINFHDILIDIQQVMQNGKINFS